MAKFTKVVDGVTEEVTNTLNFMGKDYSEVWKENNTYCDCCILVQVEKDYPDLPEEESGIIDGIDCLDEDELLDSLTYLTEYERSE